ncbi:MAG: endonuclease, partial [Bacteroidota bacterium]
MTQTVRTFQPAKPFIHGFFGLLLLVLFSTSGLAGIPAGYYDPAAGKTGATLKTALYNIIKGHTSKSYDYLWTAFQTTDKKANGKVWDMYSDIPGGTPPYEFTFGTNQCGNYGGEGDCFNREHSWPKSWFGGTVAPMYTDLFHLCPTDGYVNGNRSNYPFGTVSSPSWTSLNGSKVGPCSWTGYTGTVFEPRDDFKGDFARNYLYMATRYENLIAGWPGNDANAAAILAGNTYPAFKTWYVGMLLSWSAADPVSAKEIARNDAVYSIQNNRNPYIDHPEYAIAVWAPETIKGEPTNFPTSFTVTTGSPSWSSLSLTWTDATGIVIPDGYLIRGSATSFAAIAAPVDGTPVDDGGLDKNIPAGTQAYTFRGLATNTTYYFKIFPYTNTGGLINFKTTGTIPQASFTTTPVMGSGLIFISQYYEDAGSNKWIEVTNPGSDIDLAADPVYLMIISGSTAQNVTNTNPALCASLNTGVFEGGTSRLIKNPSSTLPSYAVADFSSLNMNFDGTYDVVFLSMSGNTLAPLSWNARTDAAGEVINNLTTSTSIADRSLYRRNIFTSGAMTFSSGDWVQNTNAEVDIAAAGTPERLGFHGFNYFSKATGNLDLLATWGTAADGSGTMPAGFNFINQIFTVQNRSSATVAGDWTIAAPGSKLIIGNGVNSSTVSGSVYNISVPSLEIRANGTLDV